MRSRDFLAIGLPIHDTSLVIPTYAKLCSRLQSNPRWREIGQNNLWIAAMALAFSKSLVTRNRRHFECVGDLRIEILVPGA